MDAISLGLGTLVVVVLVIAVAALLVVTRLFRKVEQGKALIVSKMRKVDVTFTGQVVLPVLHKAEVMDISVKTIEISRTGRDGLICKDNIRADIRISFFVRVNKTVEDVIKVAQAIGTQRASDKATLQELFDQHRQQEQADGTRQDLERLALGGSWRAGSLMAKMSRRMMYAAWSGWSPVVTQDATARAVTAAAIPASAQRSLREKREPTGRVAPERRADAPARAPAMRETASRATIPRPVAAATARSSGRS